MDRHIFSILIALFVLTGGITNGQDLLGKQEVDSAFVGFDYSDWSARVFSTYKYATIVIRDDDARVKYRPVDPLSAGIGFSYKTWVVDIGFRLNTNSVNHTKRIDLATSALIGPHLIDIGLLYYKGLEEITDNYVDPFREDVSSLTMNLDYLYFPNFRKFSYTGSRTGLGFQKKSVGSPLVGGFAERHYTKGDSTLVPDSDETNFDDSMTFSNFSNRSAGILFGYAQFLPLTENLYGAIILTSGVGGYWGVREYDLMDDNRTSGVIFQLNLYMALGYNWKRIYAIINYGNDNRFMELGNDRHYNYNIGRIKFAVGYKLLRKRS